MYFNFALKFNYKYSMQKGKEGGKIGISGYLTNTTFVSDTVS